MAASTPGSQFAYILFFFDDYSRRHVTVSFGLGRHLHLHLRHGQLHVRKIPHPCPAAQAGTHQIIVLHLLSI